uniref:Reverse transcriptase domain-containing protein n=1 Tax=Stegastes partitus TaxID=144197 RepID=A0A3B4ZND7_9TELE
MGKRILVESFLTGLNLPTLNEEQQDVLDAPITTEEIVEVIRSLSSGKAPGLDGFTAEFFKCFATELAPLLLDVYTEAFDAGSSTQLLKDKGVSAGLQAEDGVLSVRHL